MVPLNLSGHTVDMKNIVIGGRASSGRTNLAMILAEDLIVEQGLHAYIITDESPDVWRSFCVHFPGKLNLCACKCPPENVDSKYKSGNDVLCEFYKAYIRTGVIRNSVVVFDCGGVPVPDEEMTQVLDEWQTLCDTYNNYLIIITDYATILSTSDIILLTGKDKGKLNYSYYIRKYGSYGECEVKIHASRRNGVLRDRALNVLILSLKAGHDITESDLKESLLDILLDYQQIKNSSKLPFNVGDIVYVLVGDSIRGFEKSKVIGITVKDGCTKVELQSTLSMTSWCTETRFVDASEVGVSLFVDESTAELCVKNSRRKAATVQE